MKPVSSLKVFYAIRGRGCLVHSYREAVAVSLFTHGLSFRELSERGFSEEVERLVGRVFLRRYRRAATEEYLPPDVLEALQ